MEKPITEIRKSLRTKDFEKAKRLCQIEAVAFAGKMAEARRKLDSKANAVPPSDEELYYLATDWFVRLEREEEKRRTAVLTDADEAQTEQEIDSLIDEAALYTAREEHLSQSALNGLADAFLKSRPELAIEAGSPAYRQLGALLKRAKAESLNRSITRLGVRRTGRPDEAFESFNAHSQPPAPPKNRTTLKQLTDEFMDYQAKNRSENTPVTYAITIRALLEVLGERKLIAEITNADIQRVAETFRRVPAFVSQRYAGLPLLKAIELADAEDNTERLSSQTVSKYFNNLCAVFNYAKDVGKIAESPAKAKRLFEQFRAKRRKKTTRQLFTKDELASMFRAPLYTGCVDDELGYAKPGSALPRRGRFWVPLIALFHGCRLGEICQLYTEDVKESEGIPYLAIRTQLDEEDETDKRLKTEASIRDVPLHPELLRLGFMEFVAERRKDKGKPRLFPELKIAKSTKRYSTKFSRWFCRFIEHASGHKPKATFHSLRHHFRTELSRAGVGIELVDEIGGWADEDRGMNRNYLHLALKRTAEAIAKVSYEGLDLSHLKPFVPPQHRA
ncbi:MAG: site-specific integrase [Verrucomicrobiales bacterium]|nr:site-specific integrase [Verrucomicrobiales bacterium]